MGKALDTANKIVDQGSGKAVLRRAGSVAGDLLHGTDLALRYTIPGYRYVSDAGKVTGRVGKFMLWDVPALTGATLLYGAKGVRGAYRYGSRHMAARAAAREAELLASRPVPLRDRVIRELIERRDAASAFLNRNPMLKYGPTAMLGVGLATYLGNKASAPDNTGKPAALK